MYLEEMLDEQNYLGLTDSYKITHYKQLPPKTQYCLTYLESRGGLWKETIFFGLQYLLKRHFSNRFNKDPLIEEILEMHFGQDYINHDGIQYIIDKYDGRPPVHIRAVPEGCRVGVKNCLMTIRNTDPNCAWLPNFFESVLSHIWNTITVATQSYHWRKRITESLERTGTPEDAIYKMHDFGLRGVSSLQTAGAAGMAHLTSFRGTDNLPALVYARNYYGADCAGVSIPASEHFTITSWGREREVDAMRNMLAQYPTGLVACVSDSYDIYNACEKLWGQKLKQEVLARDGILVIRPDSGNPVEVISKCLYILAKKFGWEKNNKNCMVLNPKVRLIQGDGIDYETMDGILEMMETEGWSADNISFGSGGALLQKLNRDSIAQGMKCCQAVVDGQDIEVYKDPVTDNGKKSKRGYLKTIKENDFYVTKEITSDEYFALDNEDELENTYFNGEIINERTWDEILERVA